MKKIIISTILLLIFGGAIFFLGWIQLHIKDSDQVVIFSKTSGWEEKTIYPATFIWRWEAIFPTVLQRYHFSDIRKTSSFSHKETLPGGEIYQDYIPGTPDFSYSINGKIQYRLNPEALPALARDEGLRPDTQQEYLQNIASTMQSLIVQHISDFINHTELNTGSNISKIQLEITKIFQESLPQVELLSIILSKVELPDFELYKIAREQYYSVLEADTTLRQQVRQELSQIQLFNQIHTENLKEVAILLDSHPGLLEYLTAAAEFDNDLLGLSTLLQGILSAESLIGDEQGAGPGELADQ